MARPPSRSAEDEVRIVLAVLRGEVTIATGVVPSVLLRVRPNFGLSREP